MKIRPSTQEEKDKEWASWDEGPGIVICHADMVKAGIERNRREGNGWNQI